MYESRSSYGNSRGGVETHTSPFELGLAQTIKATETDVWGVEWRAGGGVPGRFLNVSTETIKKRGAQKYVVSPSPTERPSVMLENLPLQVKE